MLKIKGFELWFHYQPASHLTIDYTPLATDDVGMEHRLDQYHNQFGNNLGTLPEALRNKLARLCHYVAANLDVPEIEIGTTRLRGNPALVYYEVTMSSSLMLVPRLSARYRITPDSMYSDIDIEISAATRRLIENILPMCEQLAWDHLQKALGHQSALNVSTKKKVLISYRKTRSELKDFAAAIAHRLGREGFLPWFDEWEIRAGDSIPRELTGALKDVYGIVIVLTRDYPGDRWAREELEAAITKRTEQGIRVIPVLYENCDRPELLRALSYVDCTDHSDGQFDRQFLKLIDALNEIELNPYRR